MQALKQFSLPIEEMKIGVKSYQFELDAAFFSEFESKIISDGKLIASLDVDKKLDHFVLELSFDGTIAIECDRCTDAINYPLSSELSMLLKYAEEAREEEEVIFIEEEDKTYNCAQFIYEQVILSLPITKTCDDVDNKDCDPDVLEKLHGGNRIKKIEGNNPFDEALKNLKL